MRGLLLLLLVFTFPLWLRAQNLLLNGSFEEENVCTEYAQHCAPEGWLSTTLHHSYYFDDSSLASDGRHFVGLVLARADRPEAQNFLRSRLLCGLRKNAQYQLEFSVRSAHPVFDSIGIYFSAHDFMYQKEKLKTASPQLLLKGDKNITATKEWQKVRFIYTASGEENFIAIGDFKKDSHQVLAARPDLRREYYFFLDDIRLTPLNPSEHLCAEAEAIRKEEYRFDVRHNKLDRLLYAYSKHPPAVTPLPPTSLRRIDTLVIPDVLFATNSYLLSERAKVLLDGFISATQNVRVDSVVVEGHTDSQGSFPVNQKLSESRAASVADYLTPHYRSALLTRGWASHKPVADNESEEGRQKNRRVDIYVYISE